jgi:triacylglycerol lipase
MLVILQHGLFGFGAKTIDTPLGPRTFDYFHDIAPLLRARGHQVLTPGVNPVGTVEQRSAQMLAQIQASPIAAPFLGGKRILVIAHSMGGLDARHLMSPVGQKMGGLFTALVTIATPHRGSPVADAVGLASGKFIASQLLYDIAGLDTLAVSNLTTAFCTKFDSEMTDDPGVRYYSISTDCPIDKVPPIFFFSFPLVRLAAGANDGVVPISSSTHGTVLAPSWPVDHLRAINMPWIVDLVVNPDDVIPRYNALFDRLEKDGVLVP